MVCFLRSQHDHIKVLPQVYFRLLTLKQVSSSLLYVSHSFECVGLNDSEICRPSYLGLTLKYESDASKECHNFFFTLSSDYIMIPCVLWNRSDVLCSDFFAAPEKSPIKKTPCTRRAKPWAVTHAAASSRVSGSPSLFGRESSAKFDRMVRSVIPNT